MVNGKLLRVLISHELVLTMFQRGPAKPVSSEARVRISQVSSFTALVELFVLQSAHGKALTLAFGVNVKVSRERFLCTRRAGRPFVSSTEASGIGSSARCDLGMVLYDSASYSDDVNVIS